MGWMDEQMSLLLTHKWLRNQTKAGHSGFNREAGVVISSLIPNINSQRFGYSLCWAEVSTTISGKIQNINFKDIEHKTIPHIFSRAWLELIYVQLSLSTVDTQT